MARRTQLALTAGAALIALTGLAMPGDAAPKPTRFGAPVQITPPNGGGYEPGVITDTFGNFYATAHKENAELVVSPDGRNPALVRSQSWAWYSPDGGTTWKNLPEGPGDVYSHTFGDEGDLTRDDAGNVYLVDTNVKDINFTAWHASGRDQISFVRHLPTVGFGEPLADRPWVTAHQDGHVFYFGNEGDKSSYPAAHMGEQYGSGTGPGRFTVYSSYDGGSTWDHVGTQLADSGWCRPQAAPRSKYIYVLCTNDSGADGNVHNQGDAGYAVGTIWAYVSADDGKTWRRYDTGARYNGHTSGGYYSWPSLNVAKDGSIWGLYLNGVTPGCSSASCTPTSSRFIVVHSTDHGRHWKVMDATPSKPGIYEYAWLAVAPDGKTLGLATYGHAKAGAPWYVYGSTFRPGAHPVLTSLDPEKPVSTFSGAPGDFLTAAFDPSGHLGITWTRDSVNASTPVATAGVLRDIFFARSL
ncbi:MAG: glycoside hydrolase [Actinomycetota bacterium]|nr:glycoside hydrolase [Actinomycetota bacterium]